MLIILLVKGTLSSMKQNEWYLDLKRTLANVTRTLFSYVSNAQILGQLSTLQQHFKKYNYDIYNSIIILDLSNNTLNNKTITY